MKLWVDHVIVIQQEVEVPDECPTCGQELNKEGVELKVFEYQDQSRTGKIISESRGGNFPELDWPDLPEAGESFIHAEWHCKHCWQETANPVNKSLLAMGEEVRIDWDDAGTDVKRALLQLVEEKRVSAREKIRGS